MQVSTILDLAIVAIPTCYAALLAVRFATGLSRLGKRPNAPAAVPAPVREPQMPNSDHAATAVKMEPQQQSVTPVTVPGDVVDIPATASSDQAIDSSTTSHSEPESSQCV